VVAVQRIGRAPAGVIVLDVMKLLVGSLHLIHIEYPMQAGGNVKALVIWDLFKMKKMSGVFLMRKR
jgi:hypothetical protein